MSTHETTQERKFDREMAVIVFMLVFWPILLVLGVIDHFFMPDHDLRLFALLFAAAVGGLGVQLQRRRTEASSG
jgi:hypothetical protein